MPVDRIIMASLIFIFSGMAIAAEETQQPSEDLLEFLGTWENLDGEWVDPTQLQDMTMLDQDSTRGKSNEK